MDHAREWRGRVFIGVSLDGFVARMSGEIDWLTNPPPGARHEDIASSKNAENWESFFPTVDHVVMGRKTFETVVEFPEWPEIYGGKQIIVLSQTLPPETEHAIVANSVENVVKLLHEHQASQVYIDGGQTIQTFLNAGLIDEITLCWAPVLIGAGRRLFDNLQIQTDIRFEIVGSHVSEGGMVHTTYRALPPF